MAAVGCYKTREGQGYCTRVQRPMCPLACWPMCLGLVWGLLMCVCVCMGDTPIPLHGVCGWLSECKQRFTHEHGERSHHEQGMIVENSVWRWKLLIHHDGDGGNHQHTYVLVSLLPSSCAVGVNPRPPR